MYGSEGRKKIRFTDKIKQNLPEIPTQFETSSDLNNFKTRYLDVVSILVKSRDAYIDGIGEFDSNNILLLARNLALGNEIPVFRVVYGATLKMPLRGLSYFLPALVLMRRLKEANFDVPQLQLIFANNLSGYLDGLDLRRVREESLAFSQIAKSYIEKFFPDLSQRVIFLEDSKLEKNSLLREKLIEAHQMLRVGITGYSRGELLKKGPEDRRRLGLFYAAAHLLVHDQILPIFRPLLPTDNPEEKPGFIVSIGGIQEERFYLVRHEIRSCFEGGFLTKTLQFFTKHSVPPYYMARGGDIALDQVDLSIDRAQIAKAAGYDLAYLFSTTERTKLLDFIRNRKEEVSYNG